MGEAKVVEAIRKSPDKRCSHVQMRFDAGRETRLLVTRNVNGHVHVTIGEEVIMILHPHTAGRLIADISAVLKGSDFARA